MLVLKRIVIYPKDVQNIMGSTPKTAYKLMRDIREHLNKPKYGFVTVKEFCRYTGISEEEVDRFITD